MLLTRACSIRRAKHRVEFGWRRGDAENVAVRPDDDGLGLKLGEISGGLALGDDKNDIVVIEVRRVSPRGNGRPGCGVASTAKR